MRTSIVWFKTDLRLYDNEILFRAVEQNDSVIPVFCLDEAHFQKTPFGFLKTGAYRANFLLESLSDLDTRLRAVGSGLIIIKGKPEEEIPKLAQEYGAQRVYAKKEVAYEEKKTAEKVEKALWEIKCSLEVYSTSTLYHAQDLPFPINEIPDVFTNFRKQVETESQVREVFPAPKQINSPSIPELDLPSLKDMGLAKIESDKRQAMDFKGGETSGLQRMQYYFFETKALSSYKETRNGMVGENFSTKFSPYLSAGCLSPRGIYHEIKKYEEQHGANDSTYWLIFELMWRDYFRFMMKKYHNKFFQQNGIKKHDPNLPLHNQELLDKWINGKTGDDFVDANMLEIKLTGYMSNRGRQNVASYLVNDLNLDWRYGAAYFEQQLIDYDVCSNWGNWAYQAGVGNDPRGKRKFNTEKQAEDYDPDRTYRKLWLKEEVTNNDIDKTSEKPSKDTEKKGLLTESDKNRIIEMAWEDRTPFDAITFQFGLKEDEVKSFMKKTLKFSSYKSWRKRVENCSTKHLQTRTDRIVRFKSKAQRGITGNRISKKKY